MKLFGTLRLIVNGHNWLFENKTPPAPLRPKSSYPASGVLLDSSTYPLSRLDVSGSGGKYPGSSGEMPGGPCTPDATPFTVIDVVFIAPTLSYNLRAEELPNL
jgi:hypothetical protein